MTICFLTKRELAFYEPDEKDTTQNKRNHIKVLNYAFEYEVQLQEHLKLSTFFRGTVP